MTSVWGNYIIRTCDLQERTHNLPTMIFSNRKKWKSIFLTLHFKMPLRSAPFPPLWLLVEHENIGP